MENNTQNNTLNNSEFELKDTISQRLEKEIIKNNSYSEHSKLISINEIIMNIAHQWRQPLTVVSGNLVLLELLNDKGKLTNEKLKEKLIESSKQIDLMSKTIDDFRDFFKPDKNKEEFFLKEAVENTVNIIKPTFDKDNIEIFIDIDPSIKINNFKGEYSQVILNLLNNSKDAFLLNDIKNSKIFISVKTENDKIITKLSDNAGGIKIQPIEKIFEPYVSTKHQSAGTGIGLYMCMMIIEKNMHGVLEVENINNGASFTITL